MLPSQRQIPFHRAREIKIAVHIKMQRPSHIVGWRRHRERRRFHWPQRRAPRRSCHVFQNQRVRLIMNLSQRHVRKNRRRTQIRQRNNPQTLSNFICFISIQMNRHLRPSRRRNKQNPSKHTQPRHDPQEQSRNQNQSSKPHPLLRATGSHCFLIGLHLHFLGPSTRGPVPL